jgi:predicted ATPase
LCNALGHAALPVALYVGDLAAAEQFQSMLLNFLTDHPLTMWNALSLCLRGVLLVKQGDATGLPLLRSALDELHDMRFHLRYAAYLGMLADGLGAAGQMAQARATIEEALEWSNRSEERWYMPELLRIKGELSRLEGSAVAVRTAEDHYREALDWASRQDALSWELRAAMSLAQLWEQHGRPHEANQLLSSVYRRFNEGFETNDLKTARTLIDRLHTTVV